MPVKAFAHAKARLAPALAAADRAELAQRMAEQVVSAAAPLPVAIACDDEHVATWARTRGATVVWTPGLGLDGAVQQGCAELVASGADRVVVAHGDLPRAAGLVRFGHLRDGYDGVSVVPDRRDDGTNVISLPAAAFAAGFTFAYGVGSFGRHVAEAERCGLAVRIERIPELQWDVDTPDDLPEPIPT